MGCLCQQLVFVHFWLKLFLQMGDVLLIISHWAIKRCLIFAGMSQARLFFFITLALICSPCINRLVKYLLVNCRFVIRLKS